MDWLQHKLNNTELVEGSGWAGGPDENLIVYYCRLIYKLCLDKHAHFFVSTTTSQNLSASLKISLSYQAIYQYLVDNLVSRPSFVPTVIAALHPSNIYFFKLFHLILIVPSWHTNRCWEHHSICNLSVMTFEKVWQGVICDWFVYPMFCFIFILLQP